MYMVWIFETGGPRLIASVRDPRVATRLARSTVEVRNGESPRVLVVVAHERRFLWAADGSGVTYPDPDSLSATDRERVKSVADL